ncbi:SMC family ATPase [Veillonellaceae bacterium M2-4]|nr:SMC family ATPase [Veillonellaceae bacterium M2-4]
MRPLYLEMQAFGPYAGKQCIDFRDLKERRLFLIYGPTGAGKTTILDAMCYALYGDTSGNRRSGAHMRSEYASPQVPTKVSFAFTVGSHYYRIERSPEQEIAKLRGSGLKKAAAMVALYETDANGEDTQVIATKNVNARVESILGFKSEQFRQVVLLPQGDFRKLLLAGSAERQQIMQILFHTERYARFQLFMKEKHDAIQQEYQQLVQQEKQGLESADLSTVELLQARITENTHQIQAIKQQIEVAQRLQEQRTQELQVATELESHFKALAEAKLAYEQLQKQEKEMAQRKVYIEQLEQAHILVDAFQQVDDIITKGKEASIRKQQVEQQRNDAREKAKQAAQTYAKLQAQQGEIEVLTGTIQQWKGWQSRINEYHKQKKRWDLIQKKEKDVKEKVAAQEKLRVEVEEKIQQVRQAEVQLAQIQTTIGDKQLALKQAHDEQNRANSRQEYKQKIETEEKNMQFGLDQLKRMQDEASRLTREYEQVYCLFIQGQASVLATTLQENMPCPVCGSQEHPAPAIPLAAIPTQDEVEEKKKKVEEVKDKCQKKEVIIQESRTKIENWKREYGKLITGDEADKTVVQCQKEIDTLEEMLKTLSTQVQTITTSLQCMPDMEKQLHTIEVDIKEQQDTYMTYHEEAIRLATDIAIVEQEIPVEYRMPNAVDRAIQKEEKTVAKFKENVQQAEKERLQQGQLEVQLQTVFDQECKKHKQLQADYKEAWKLLVTRVQEAGFDSPDQCRMLQERWKELDKEKQVLQDYEEKRSRHIGVIKKEEACIQGQVRPAVEEKKQAMQAVNEQVRQASEKKATLNEQVQQDTKLYERMQAGKQRQNVLMEEYKVVGSVYELVSGKQTGINFERYVLGALLDEVLAAANLRLHTMSRQRYELQRSHSWDDKRVKQIGLDIEVFDNYTGYARPANTLSGGETFLASLALALGLADVVQTYSGGIHLDTIFIDEGFGTLDDETLDFALKTLLQLQGNGRLVGIISHVAELKERITTRLAIQKTKQGSTAAFELLN